MSNSSIKAINIISYILNVLLVVALVVALKGGFKGTPVRSHANVYNAIKTSIVQQERAQLPLTIQKLDDVNDVVIDSLVLTNNVEPYQGYLVTQWSYKPYGKKSVKKQVLVEVSNITCTPDKITWNSNWLGAYLSIL